MIHTHLLDHFKHHSTQFPQRIQKLRQREILGDFVTPFTADILRNTIIFRCVCEQRAKQVFNALRHNVETRIDPTNTLSTARVTELERSESRRIFILRILDYACLFLPPDTSFLDISNVSV